ncbi:hypothetical protein [Vibrio phage vB_VhaP_PG11]|nr:hypothetical protein [Vibrio phage vB_VhaP_PG11]
MSQVQAITVTTKATGALDKVVVAVTKAVADLQLVAEQHESLLVQVAEAQQNLDSLGETTAVAVRQQAVDLDLRVQENENEVLNHLLNTRGLTTIEPNALSALRDEATRANYDAQAEISKAVKAALAKAATDAKLEAAEKSQEVAVAAAETRARIESLEAQLMASKREVTSLTEQLSAEREAGIERARAAGSMTINTSSK